MDSNNNNIKNIIQNLNDNNQFELASQIEDYYNLNKDDKSYINLQQGSKVFKKKEWLSINNNYYLDIFIRTVLIGTTVAVISSIGIIYSINYVLGNQMNQITDIVRNESKQIRQAIVGQIRAIVPDITKSVQKEIPLISDRLQNEIPNITDRIIKKILEAKQINK